MTNIITWPLCLAKYGRKFAVEILLYKLCTWQIHTGLRSQTSSAIITNYWRSPGYTRRVRIGLLLIGKKLHSINTQIVFDACYNILDIVAKWPGSTHDSWILMESGLTQLFEQMPLLLAIHFLWPKRFCLGGALSSPHEYISLSSSFSMALSWACWQLPYFHFMHCAD